MLSRGFLFAALSFSLLAQTPDNRFAALKDALGLSNLQLWQLQQQSPDQTASPGPVSINLQGTIRAFPNNAIGIYGVNSNRPPFGHEQDPSKYALLGDSQRTKVQDVVDKIWRHPPTARLAIAIELTSAYPWPRYQCPGGLHGPASDLDLTGSQILRLQELRQSSGATLIPEIATKEYRRAMLLNSGNGAESPAIVQLVSEISALRGQATSRRDLALAVLGDAQKVKLAEFEAALQLLSEARELRLIPAMGGGEVLCQ